MNERIRELINECSSFKEGDTEGLHDIEVFDKEKFAELIVRECIWALWTEECRTSDLASEEYTRGSNKIKQHFGIEE